MAEMIITMNRLRVSDLFALANSMRKKLSSPLTNSLSLAAAQTSRFSEVRKPSGWLGLGLVSSIMYFRLDMICEAGSMLPKQIWLEISRGVVGEVSSNFPILVMQ